MVEATPPIFEDRCRHCGKGFEPGESRWVEQRSYMVHTRCARWETWESLPYLWKLKELRKRYRETRGRGASENREGWNGDPSNAEGLATGRCRARESSA